MNRSPSMTDELAERAWREKCHPGERLGGNCWAPLNPDSIIKPHTYADAGEKARYACRWCLAPENHPAHSA